MHHFICTLQERTDEAAAAISSKGMTAKMVFLERSSIVDTLLIYLRRYPGQR
jgi:hypothetical protein